MRISDWSSDVCSSDLAAIAGHPALARNSKSGAAFTEGERQRDLAAAEAAYGEELSQVLGWAEAVAGQADIPLILPGPLPVRCPLREDRLRPEVVLILPVAQPWGRSAERRVGKESVRTCSSRWSPYT